MFKKDKIPNCVIPYYSSIHNGYIQIISCQNNILISKYFDGQFKLKKLQYDSDNNKILLSCNSCGSRGMNVMIHDISCSFAKKTNNIILNIDNISIKENNKIKIKDHEIDQTGILNKLINDNYMGDDKEDIVKKKQKINQMYEKKKIKNLSKSMSKLTLKK